MNARDAAVVALDGKHLPGLAPRALKRARMPRDLDDRGRALARTLELGVVRHLLHLQWVLETVSGRRLRQIDAGVAKVCLVGLYQLRMMDHVPPAVAVDEAVGQARRLGMARAAGFVNAVLRKAVDAQLPEVSPEDPRRYAELMLSCPPTLFDRLRRLVSSDAEALSLCRHNNAEPPTLLRLAPGVDAGQLTGDGVTVTPHEQPGIAVVVGGKQRHFAAWSAAGLAQVQDATSALLGALADPAPGANVLDRCCGNGTKTIQMWEAMSSHGSSQGSIIAIDADPARVDRLGSLLRTRKIRNVQPIVSRTVPLDRPEGHAVILVDAPCSNSGVLPRRPEAKYRQDARRLASLSALQRDILADTLGHLGPGGRFVYLTCSLWPEENEQVADALRQLRPDLREVTRRRILPSFTQDSANRPDLYRDGGFGVVFERK